jgi:hypothetical protein
VPNEWADCCLDPTWSNAENAFGFIQEAVAVFDYYDNANVKRRYQEAYGDIIIAMKYFEAAYSTQYGVSISGTMHDLWRNYMRAHMGQFIVFAELWCAQRRASCELCSGGNFSTPCTLAVFFDWWMLRQSWTMSVHIKVRLTWQVRFASILVSSNKAAIPQ